MIGMTGDPRSGSWSARLFPQMLQGRRLSAESRHDLSACTTWRRLQQVLRSMTTREVFAAIGIYGIVVGLNVNRYYFYSQLPPLTTH